MALLSLRCRDGALVRFDPGAVTFSHFDLDPVRSLFVHLVRLPDGRWVFWQEHAAAPQAGPDEPIGDALVLGPGEVADWFDRLGLDPPSDPGPPPCPVEFRPGEHNNVVVPGVGATHVDGRALKALRALVDAYPGGLTPKEPGERSGLDGLPADLNRLRSRNPVLRHVLLGPKEDRGRPKKDEALVWKLAPARTT